MYFKDISRPTEVQRHVHGLSDGHAGKGELAAGRRRPWDTRGDLSGMMWEHVGFKHARMYRELRTSTV